MAEYIDREAFIEAVKDIPMWGSVAVMFADSISAEDVAPVRHGYWVIDDYNTRECHCSECDWPAPRDAYGYHREQTGYCHVCGAEMELDD